MSEKYYRLYCDSCEALAINGYVTHETGCPRRNEKWRKRRKGFMTPDGCDIPSWAQKERVK